MRADATPAPAAVGAAGGGRVEPVAGDGGRGALRSRAGAHVQRLAIRRGDWAAEGATRCPVRRAGAAMARGARVVGAVRRPRDAGRRGRTSGGGGPSRPARGSRRGDLVGAVVFLSGDGAGSARVDVSGGQCQPDGGLADRDRQPLVQPVRDRHRVCGPAGQDVPVGVRQGAHLRRHGFAPVAGLQRGRRGGRDDQRGTHRSRQWRGRRGAATGARCQGHSRDCRPRETRDILAGARATAASRRRNAGARFLSRRRLDRYRPARHDRGRRRKRSPRGRVMLAAHPALRTRHPAPHPALGTRHPALP